MEKIDITCQCGKRLLAPPEMVGKSVRCPACGSPLQILAPSAPAEPEAPNALNDLFSAFSVAPPSLPPPQPQRPAQPFSHASIGPSPGGRPPYAAAAAPRRSRSQGNPMLWVGIGGGALLVILLLIVGAGVLGSGGFGAPSWRPHRSAGGRYSVDMPASVKTNVKSQATAVGPITVHMATANRGSRREYGVLYSDYPARHIGMANANTVLTKAAQGIASSGRLINIRDISINGHPGKEVKFSGIAAMGNRDGVNRMYLVGRRLYQVMYIGPANELDSPETLRFLNSFTLN